MSVDLEMTDKLPPHVSIKIPQLPSSQMVVRPEDLGGTTDEGDDTIAPPFKR